jgi:hypothetical protein
LVASRGRSSVLVIFIVRLAGSQAARRNDRGYQGLSRCASEVDVVEVLGDRLGRPAAAARSTD